MLEMIKWVLWMKKLSTLSTKLNKVKVILTDIDDTITTGGVLTSEAYCALEALQDAGFLVIPVTGRSAGWCDHIARMWPVDAIVGENGAFYYRYDRVQKKLHKYFCQNNEDLKSNTQKLNNISTNIFAKITGVKLASDQEFRITDLAIDFAEDVEPLDLQEAQKIVDIAEAEGAIAKISSIHVNCWFGDHSKLSTSLTLLENCFNMAEEQIQESVIFIGDSPNDASMFDYFDLSIGVANITKFRDTLLEKPTYVTQGFAGKGFTEVANHLLADIDSIENN